MRHPSTTGGKLRGQENWPSTHDMRMSGEGRMGPDYTVMWAARVLEGPHHQSLCARFAASSAPSILVTGHLDP